MVFCFSVLLWLSFLCNATVSWWLTHCFWLYADIYYSISHFITSPKREFKTVFLICFALNKREQHKMNNYSDAFSWILNGWIVMLLRECHAWFRVGYVDTRPIAMSTKRIQEEPCTTSWKAFIATRHVPSKSVKTKHSLFHIPEVYAMQGCILSPLLFNLYLNNLPHLFEKTLPDPV